MRGVSIARISVLGVSAAVACLGISIDAQAPKAGAAKSAKTIARTPDGHPDLQGIYDFSTATPLERPVALGDKAVFTDEEAAAFVKQQLGNRAASDDAPLPKGNVGGYNQFWYEFGTQVVPDKRTSLITDPSNGRLPALTPEAQKIADGHREQLRRLADGPEQRDVSERCLLGYNAGPPMVGVGYNQHVQIVQTPEYVLIHTEMVHTARIVPLDGRPHFAAPFRPWSGDSRGHWEGDTLVVETTNFNDKSWNQFSGWNWAADQNMHVTERFSIVDGNMLNYQFTVNDPTVWTKPWTASAPLRRTDEQMFEYACHEGNYGMAGILQGARAEERRDGESGKK